jgi:ParB-like chromosome segregation protein Spo0J
MPTLTQQTEIPHSAYRAIGKTEELGFTKWSFQFDYPTPKDTERRVQVRDTAHYAPSEDISAIVAAIKQRSELPPIVVTADGYLIDGNTRVRAHNKLHHPELKAIVLDVKYESASEAVRRRLQALGAALNSDHGRKLDRKEVYSAILALGADERYDANRIAKLVGVTESTVHSALAERNARERAEKLGVHVNGSIPASQLRSLGRSNLQNRPCVELVKLTQDAGLSGSEVADLIRKIRELGDDDAAVALLSSERTVRDEQIQEFRASRKARPTDSAKARQRMGFFLEFREYPERLVEHNPHTKADHEERLRATVEVLQRALDASRAGRS